MKALGINDLYGRPIHVGDFVSKVIDATRGGKYPHQITVDWPMEVCETEDGTFYLRHQHRGADGRLVEDGISYFWPSDVMDGRWSGYLIDRDFHAKECT
jgi:hypothetical protein